MRAPYRFSLIGVAALALLGAGCSSSSSTPSSSSSSGATNWATVTSAAAGGGMSKLIAAAKKEGTLNVIALPSDWANYGNIIKEFAKQYGIKVNSIAPDDSSAQEVTQIQQKNGTSLAADVLDVGSSVATASTTLFAPYKVSTWSSIPADQKSPTGLYVEDYGGYMSVGYNSAKFPAITSLSQLLGSKFKSAVALNGNPTEANAALNGVMMANLADGGTAGSIANGVNFFQKLKAAGNYVPVQATAATIKAGTTPVVFNWDYLNTAAVVGAVELEGVHPVQRHPGRLLQPGHQQERATPSRGPAVGGVPLLAGRGWRAEPVAGRRRTAGRAGGHDLKRHHQQDGGRGVAAGHGDADIPDPGPGHRRRHLPGGELGQGRQLGRDSDRRCDD